MKQVTINAYEFNELSEEAKDVVRQWYNETWMNDEWYDCEFDGFKDDMRELGIEVDEIYFSGFWSQGDGASFTASVDPIKFLQSQKVTKEYWRLYTNLLHGALEGYFNIAQSGHYYHDKTMYVSSEFDGNIYYDCEDDAKIAQISKQTHGLAEHVLDFCREQARELYKLLRQQYEWLTSDAEIAERLGYNEVYFDERGRLLPKH